MRSIWRLTKNRVARNAGWLIGGNIIYKLIAFIVGIWTARYLGPSNYGLITYASAYTTFFFSLCTLGINSILVKNFVDYPEEEGITLGTSLALQGVSSLLSIGMICLIVFFVDYGDAITLTVVFLCSLGLFFQMMQSIQYWFQAKLESKYVAIATTTAYIITSLYKVVLLISGADVVWFAIATSVDYLTASAIMFVAYKAKNGPKLGFSKLKAVQLIKDSYHFIFSGLMISIYGATDRLMLKHMIDESAVGYYGTAQSLCDSWTFILAAIITSLTPVIIDKHNTDMFSYEKTNKKLYAIVFYCSAIVGLLITFLAEPIIKILYGQSYIPSIQPLRILTWYSGFSYLGVARDAWVICENNQKYLPYLYMCSAILNVILNALMIPSMGASGAALATLITQFGTVFIFPVFIKNMRPNVKLMLDAILIKGIK